MRQIHQSSRFRNIEIQITQFFFGILHFGNTFLHIVQKCYLVVDQIVAFDIQYSGVRLHSHDVKYGSGSGQQSVTAVQDGDDVNSHWQILGCKFIHLLNIVLAVKHYEYYSVPFPYF